MLMLYVTQSRQRLVTFNYATCGAFIPLLSEGSNYSFKCRFTLSSKSTSIRLNPTLYVVGSVRNLPMVTCFLFVLHGSCYRRVKMSSIQRETAITRRRQMHSYFFNIKTNVCQLVRFTGYFTPPYSRGPLMFALLTLCYTHIRFLPYLTHRLSKSEILYFL